MKSSEELDRFIAITASYYCKRLKIGPNNIPDIITGGIVLPEKINSTLDDEVYGQYYSGYGILHLKINDIPDYEVLERTIVHELVHVKYGKKLKHGKKFEQKVEEVLI